MDTMSRSFRLEGSSWRKVGRSNSSLLASELVGSEIEIARLAAYERLSESMRVATADEYSARYSRISSRRRKTKGWSFLVKDFSFRKRDTAAAADDVCSRQVVEEAALKPPPETVVLVAEKKSMKSVWFPNPHRRWPVQGWWCFLLHLALLFLLQFSSFWCYFLTCSSRRALYNLKNSNIWIHHCLWVECFKLLYAKLFFLSDATILCFKLKICNSPDNGRLESVTESEKNGKIKNNVNGKLSLGSTSSGLWWSPPTAMNPFALP